MLLNQIKADQLTARKTKQSLKTSLLTTLLGELETDSKAKKSTEITDEKVIAKIKKFCKSLYEVVEVTSIEDKRNSMALIELQILESYLPKQFTEEELKVAVANCIVSAGVETSPKNMGIVMKELKSHYDGQYDGKMASQIVKQLLAK